MLRVFHAPQRGHVELGDPAGKEIDAIALSDPEGLKDVGEAIGQLAERSIGVLSHRPAGPEPAQGDSVAAGAGGVAVDRLVGDVEAAPARQAVKLTPGPVQRKLSASLRVVAEVRGHVAPAA